jgi:hypothetical protein
MKAKGKLLVTAKIFDKKRTFEIPEKSLRFDLKAYRIIF